MAYFGHALVSGGLSIWHSASDGRHSMYTAIHSVYTARTVRPTANRGERAQKNPAEAGRSVK